MGTVNAKTAVTLMGLGALVIGVSIPLLLGKIKMNHLYGFRFRKAFQSEENWYAINAYGAKALLCWSIIIMAFGIACLYIEPQHALTVAKITFISVLVPVGIHRVWVTDVDQEEFERIAHVTNPVSLVVYGMQVQDLSPLVLMNRIETLALQWNTKTNDIGGLDELKNLRALCRMDFPRLTSLDALGCCRNLEMLDLAGGVWKPLKVKTLEPLRSLRALKYLSLTNIKVDDDSLQPLTELTNLEELNLSNQFPTEEYARLSVHLEHVSCSSFSPYVSMEGKIVGKKTIMITGRRKPFLDPQADKQRIERYERQFRQYQALFRAEKGRVQHGSSHTR